ncbi:hypothetical protein CHUAL_005610 [Chamberlinius hualienensis]
MTSQVCEPDLELEDEDFELENSPLYHYMQEYANHTKESEVHQRTSTAWLSNIKENLNAFKCRISSLIFERMFQFIRKTAGYSQFLFIMNETFRVEHQTVLKESNILLEDDVNFLENVIDQDKADIIFDMKEIYISKLAFPVVLVGCWKVGLFPNTPMISTGVIICACTIAYSIISLLWLHKRHRTLKESLEITKEVVSNSDDILRCCNKCLTYIRELDVFGKGMLLPVPEFSLSKLENSSLFISSSVGSKLNFRARRYFNCGNYILLNCMLLDNEQNYVAFLNNSEIESLLNKEISESNFKTVDEIAFSELKVLYQLLHLHLSECVRRLCLCFSKSITSTSSHPTEAFFIGSKVFVCLNQEIKSDLIQLNEDYKLHQYISSSWNKEIKPKKWSNYNQQNTSLQGVQSSIKSLSLHLIAALARIHEVSDNLSENEETQYDTILSQLQLLQQDMQAGQFCVEESFSRLLKLRGYSEPIVDEPSGSPKPFVSEISALVPIIPSTEKVDIASEDQVFEAYITSDETREDGSEYYEVDTVAEKQREISRKLFAELKTVLVPKAKEWKVREAKALGISEQDALNDSSTEESIIQENGVKYEHTSNEDSDTEINSAALQSSQSVTNFPPYCLSYSDSNESAPLPNDMIAAVAILAARRARDFPKHDECFECDVSEDEDYENDD